MAYTFVSFLFSLLDICVVNWSSTYSWRCRGEWQFRPSQRKTSGGRFQADLTRSGTTCESIARVLQCGKDKKINTQYLLSVYSSTSK